MKRRREKNLPTRMTEILFAECASRAAPRFADLRGHPTRPKQVSPLDEPDVDNSFPVVIVEEGHTAMKLKKTARPGAPA